LEPLQATRCRIPKGFHQEGYIEQPLVEQETPRNPKILKDATERARRRHLKFDQAKLVRIFNEDSRKYADYYFPDQSSLPMFFSNQRIANLAVSSNQRIAGLAVVDANSSSSLIVTDWERLVNGSYYPASLEKLQDAVELLKSDLMNSEKSASE